MISVETRSGTFAILSDQQMDEAAGVARKLHDGLRAKGVKDAHGLTDATPEMEAGGSAAELALSLLLGVDWTTSEDPDPKGPDVGTRTQVRSSSVKRDKHNLIIRPKDLRKYGDVPYVLVIQDENVFEIKGWVMASEGVFAGNFWNGGLDRPHAFFVPEAKLRPISELKSP